jgi:hypothetical protein
VDDTGEPTQKEKKKRGRKPKQKMNDNELKSSQCKTRNARQISQTIDDQLKDMRECYIQLKHVSKEMLVQFTGCEHPPIMVIFTNSHTHTHNYVDAMGCSTAA